MLGRTGGRGSSLLFSQLVYRVIMLCRELVGIEPTQPIVYLVGFW